MIKKFVNNVLNVCKDYVWFVKESSKFKSMSILKSAISIPEFVRFAKLQYRSRNMSPDELRQYLTSEGRIIEL